MNRTTTPHDALFRALVSNPRRAAALLRDHLPNEVSALLNLDMPPEPVEGTFIDGERAKTQCDALFRVRLKSGQDARIYALLEHKSVVDQVTPVQITRYMLNVWARELEEHGAGRKLPFIFPICFYHGRGHWSVPLSLAEMIEVPDGIDDPLNGFAYILRDLGAMDPLTLSQQPEVLAGLLALCLAYWKQIPPDLLDRITGGTVDGSDFESHLLNYAAQELNLTERELDDSLHRTKPDMREILMGTVAQAWKEEGMAKGMAKGKAQGLAEGVLKGKAEGKAETLLRLARLKFTTVPAKRERQIVKADPEQLDAWLDALIVAESLDAVFIDRNNH